MLIQALINRGMCNHIQIRASIFVLTKRDGLSPNDRWKCFAWKGEGAKKKKFLSALILSYSGEKCQIIEMAFKKKKLKPNLSKTLQVLGVVAIVSGNECYSAPASSSFHASCSPIDIKVHNTHLASHGGSLFIGPVNVRACCHWALSHIHEHSLCLSLDLIL